MLLLALLFPQVDSWSIVSRRQLMNHCLVSTFVVPEISNDGATDIIRDQGLLNYAYSNSWTGTALPLLDLVQASQKQEWNMGRWPGTYVCQKGRLHYILYAVVSSRFFLVSDPVLRRPASSVDASWFGTETLKRTTELLQQTCLEAKAVGLAAQQCGIDARIVHLQEPQRISMVNPKIINRSAETNMKVWQEQCLVLPPTFVATVLRDDWIDVEYYDWKGDLHKTRLRGETARAAQHEMDHDRGILVLDHVGVEEMESGKMRAIESQGHDARMALAYSRAVEESIISA